jgi:hypothetical protein
LKRFEALGVVVHRRGNEIILQRPLAPGSRKGPTFPIPDDRELHSHYVVHACRVFGLDPNDFWSR